MGLVEQLVLVHCKVARSEGDRGWNETIAGAVEAAEEFDLQFVGIDGHGLLAAKGEGRGGGSQLGSAVPALRAAQVARDLHGQLVEKCVHVTLGEGCGAGGEGDVGIPRLLASVFDVGLQSKLAERAAYRLLARFFEDG